MSIGSKLKQISLFNGIKDNPELIAKLESIISETSFSAETYIIKEGEIGNEMYILKKGEVHVEKKTLMGDSFPVVKLCAEMNVFFGELALLDNDHRSASVFSITDTECYVIQKNDFEIICQENPLIGYHIFKEIAISLAMKLRKTTKDNMALIDALCSEEVSSQ